MALAAGTRLGPYEVLGLIGAGGMGEVYRARDTRLERSTTPRTLVAGEIRPSSWTPDGRQLAAVSSGSGNFDIVTLTVGDGSASVRPLHAIAQLSARTSPRPLPRPGTASSTET